MQIDFYLLAKTQPADKLHYACRLANRARQSGVKVFVRAEDDAQNAALDKLLWTFAQDAFVPHAVHAPGDAHDAEKFPVQLGVGGAPQNFSGMLISLAREHAADYANFERVAEIILNDPAEKSAARERFRFYRAQGIEPRAHNIA